MGNRWSIDAALLVAVALVAGLGQPHHLPWSAFSQAQATAIGLALLLVWYAAGRPGAGLGALARREWIQSVSG